MIPADYVSVTQSSEYPLFFCATRWVEDKKVSDRLLCIWPNIIKIVNFWKSLLKSKQPSSKSFQNVKTAVEDVLTPAKLSFFSYFASLFEPFLRKYQTQNPMLPYLYTDIVELFRLVLKLIIKDEVVENCCSGNQLTKIDFESANIFKKSKDVTIGFSTEYVLSDLKKKDLVKHSDIQNFYDNVRKCVVSTIKEMSERCLLQSAVARNAVVFNPEIMLESTEGKLQKKFKALLQHLVLLRIVSSHKADKALIQYGNVKTDLQRAAIDLSKIPRLDDFYFKELKVAKYPEFCLVIKIVLTLSHGQAYVERGFSLNNAVLESNMKHDSVVSKRLIQDHLVSNNLKPHTMEINSKLRSSCRQARQRYHTHLEELKKENEHVSSDKAREIILVEIEELQGIISALDKSSKLLDQKFVSLVRNSEECSNILETISEANALKRKSEEQIDDMRKLQETLQILKEKKRKL